MAIWHNLRKVVCLTARDKRGVSKKNQKMIWYVHDIKALCQFTLNPVKTLIIIHCRGVVTTRFEGLLIDEIPTFVCFHVSAKIARQGEFFVTELARMWLVS